MTLVGGLKTKRKTVLVTLRLLFLYNQYVNEAKLSKVAIYTVKLQSAAHVFVC